ncbi:hypothetical protein Q4Q39_14610 [Flavivirga amylovorans]|uniref:Fibronectin type-III domain-containing protein n=1 Tax=Flavivirga amylovorans TaxID=870486 RepID=A0ABT8X414_9FLAO|nr:hypothetical protein [Flavivirga amylovorans]MDO5988641.1 hypothetical protein [Flavivirga amylovorans]
MRPLVYILCLAFLTLGCSKSSDDGVDEGQNPENPDGNPNQGAELAVNLVFPHKDGLCNLGTDITPTQSTVLFEWQASDIAENYTIVIEDLTTGTIIQAETTEDKVPVTINRATPHAWYVESSSGSKSEKSDTWKFFNAGPGVQTYAPFPAVLDAPAMALSISTASVTLQWTGSDVDDDIVGYDVYLGTSNNPSIHASDLTANELNVSVTSGTVYYWKIVTKDEVGNASDSDIFQFRVL